MLRLTLLRAGKNKRTKFAGDKCGSFKNESAEPGILSFPAICIRLHSRDSMRSVHRPVIISTSSPAWHGHGRSRPRDRQET